MRVLLHALGATMGGAVRHLTNFLPALSAVDPDREYVVLVRDSFPSPATGPNVRVLPVPARIAAFAPTRVTADIIGVPALCKKLQASVVVSLTNFGPIWSPVPHVIFQRNMLYYCPPEIVLGARARAAVAVRRRLALESMKRAALIVTPTYAMRNAIRERYPRLPENRFRVLYHGCEAGENPIPRGTRLSAALSNARGLKITYPTHAAAHKGFRTLFEIARCLKARGIEFTLVLTTSHSDGGREWQANEEQIRRLDLSDVVLNLGSVPQADISVVYDGCDLLVYPSPCESFGFPMVEALHHELPVVAADTETNREICGSAAVYYQPFDAEAGAEAIAGLVTESARRQLREAGRVRVASFDWGWRRYAREFVAMLESVR